MKRTLALLLLVAGCAHGNADRAAHGSTDGAAHDSGDRAAHDADALLAAGRYDDALARLAPWNDLDQTWGRSVAYERATALLYKRDFAGAARQFQQLVDHARAHANAEKDAWGHNALTWVRWADHDRAGALAENELVARAVAPLPEPDRRGLMLHYWWDRAYLLKEDPAQAAAAAEARAKYDALARLPDEHDGLAVLAAFFAVEDHDGARALAEARKVDPAKDDDLQDLYVLQLAYELGGDNASAEAVRALIRKGVEYPMKPIILQRLEYDRQRASGTPFTSFFTPSQASALALDCGSPPARCVSARELAERHAVASAQRPSPPKSGEFLVATPSDETPPASGR